MERPKDLNFSEWHACRVFAFNYAKHHGWFGDIQKYHDIPKSQTLGIETYEKGLDIAIATCRFWRDFYKC